MADHQLQPGLYEALLTGALDKRLADLVFAAVTPELRALADAEAADRLSRHFAMVVTRAIEALPEHGRAQAGAQSCVRSAGCSTLTTERGSMSTDRLSNEWSRPIPQG